MRRKAGQPPTGRDFYHCGMVGALLFYAGASVILAGAMVVSGEGIGKAILMILWAIAFGFFPVLVASVFVIGPIAAVIGIGLREWLPPSQWHGAVTGVLTAITLGFLASLFVPVELRGTFEARAVWALLGALMLAAASGWYAQRIVTDWPPRSASGD